MNLPTGVPYLSRAEVLLDRMNGLHDERVSRIVGRDVQFKLGEGPCLILHMIPEQMLLSRAVLDAEEIADKCTDLEAFDHGLGTHRFNVDGYAVYHESASLVRGYSQFHRNGIFEGVSIEVTYEEHNEQLVRLGICEIAIIKAVRGYLKHAQALNIQPPFWCFVTLAGAKGARIVHDHHFSDHSIDRDIVCIPPLCIENVESGLAQLLKPICDSLWNSVGFRRSLTFNEVCSRLAMT